MNIPSYTDGILDEAATRRSYFDQQRRRRQLSTGHQVVAQNAANAVGGLLLLAIVGSALLMGIACVFACLKALQDGNGEGAMVIVAFGVACLGGGAWFTNHVSS